MRLPDGRWCARYRMAGAAAAAGWPAAAAAVACAGWPAARDACEGTEEKICRMAPNNYPMKVVVAYML